MHKSLQSCPKFYFPSTLNTDRIKIQIPIFKKIFQFYLMYRLICQKPVNILSAQMALVSTFFQMFIVLKMYNFGVAQQSANFLHLATTCWLQLFFAELHKEYFISLVPTNNDYSFMQTLCSKVIKERQDLMSLS